MDPLGTEKLYPVFEPNSHPVSLDADPPAMARDRARGCVLGQLARDSLGSLVQFQSAETIRAQHPQGIRDLVDGGQWDTLAGQPTDDSELALILARTILRTGTYDQGYAAVAHAHWFLSSPFGCGNTTARALKTAAADIRRGAGPGEVALNASLAADPESQATGALMRVSRLRAST